LQDVLISIKRFCNNVRWKFYWLEEERKKKQMSPKDDKSTESKEINEGSNEKVKIKGEGLGTGLRKPNMANSAPIASREVEAFLEDATRSILTELNMCEQRPETKKAKEIRALEKKLKANGSIVIVPTDKMNSFRVVEKEKYIEWVNTHLQYAAKEVSADKLALIAKEGEALLKEINVLSPEENEFIKASIKMKAVPTPKLLIKDHKKANNKGEFPMQLVVPATNFTSAFPKVGYWNQNHS